MKKLFTPSEITVESFVSGTDMPESDAPMHIALMGTMAICDEVRKCCKQLNLNSFDIRIQDLGNLDTRVSAQELTASLLAIDASTPVIPVILADQQHYQSIVQSITTQTEHICSFIDQSLLRYKNVLSTDNAHYHRWLATQNHFHQPTNDIDLSVMRVTELRESMDYTETKIRDVNWQFMHLDSIRQADNIGHEGSWSSGLYIEEACQISKFIGAATHLQAFVIGGITSHMSVHTARNISLLLYYFLEGIQLLQRENKNSLAGSFKTYTVIPDDIDSELIFKKNLITGRWWLELDIAEAGKKLIPCTAADYEMACQNDFSDKLIDIYSRL